MPPAGNSTQGLESQVNVEGFDGSEMEKRKESFWQEGLCELNPEAGSVPSG